MHTIKKYANRKLYDTTDKRYISLDRIAELIDEGEEVKIIDSKTGDDLTSQTVSQILVRDRSVPTNILIQLLKTGKGTINFARDRVSTIQDALTSFGDETERLINRLIKSNAISETEGSKLKKEITSHTENFRTWIKDHVDQRIGEVLDMMNVASKEQMQELRKEITKMKTKITKLEKTLASKSK